MAASRVKRINVALQGGGAHGAFTWGVLHRLLDDERIEIANVSGTSAGAMNATALVQGLATGGRQGAQEVLNNFWRKISDAAKFSPIQRTLFDALTGYWALDRSPAFILSQHAQRAFSPYESNPMDINPLRDIVEDFFDFDAVNHPEAPGLFISATNVRTGLGHIFRQPEIYADEVMASACLPFLFHAVEIDGEPYWDGGYMGNPPIFPLIDETDVRDHVLIQINPFERNWIPRTAYGIENRLNEITFNASLIKELRAIFVLGEVADLEEEKSGFDAYRDGKLHRIQAYREMSKLSVSSKLNAEWAFLEHLNAIGQRTAERWLDRTFDEIGVRSTWKPEFIKSKFDNELGRPPMGATDLAEEVPLRAPKRAIEAAEDEPIRMPKLAAQPAEQEPVPAPKRTAKLTKVEPSPAPEQATELPDQQAEKSPAPSRAKR
ncbi:MAG: patatin-like phospholipase family protein [Alphaproteobacteria bacterium]|nr:patatin-like phospholipase family protein [Alphaproteobacteria bacterium]